MANIFVCGDISNPVGSVDFIGPKLKNMIGESDFAVGNLEGVELEESDILLGSPFQSAGTCQYLKDIGFDLMLLANNHITDGGKKRLAHTINVLKACGLSYIGAGNTWEEAYRPLVKEIGGLRIAFLNVCEAQPGYYRSPNQECGYAWMGYDHLLFDITHLKSEADFVVVFVHAGLEHYSLPLLEFRDFYHSLCDAGASCVIGGHPHYPQGYEYYGNSFISYSLGNFFFPRNSNAWPMENTSYALQLSLSKYKGISVSVIHHSLKNGVVEIETNKEDQVDIESLCDRLENNYIVASDEMCLNAYNCICKALLVDALCGENERIGFIESIKNVLRRSLFRKRFVNDTLKRRQRLLLRLFENETYRFIITKALNIITKDDRQN